MRRGNWEMIAMVLHADTQCQSEPVFGLAHLLGIKRLRYGPSESWLKIRTESEITKICTYPDQARAWVRVAG